MVPIGPADHLVPLTPLPPCQPRPDKSSRIPSSTTVGHWLFLLIVEQGLYAVDCDCLHIMTATTRNRKPRVTAACDFCRQRKVLLDY